ncbi:MAG: mobilization protein [Pseudomonadota bacterium]|nr:mobilization protein [Pseudomonadota bacterium]
MAKIDEQISTLQERLKNLKLRQQRHDARTRALEAQRQRKADTRRKFVVGTVVLAKVQEGKIDHSALLQWLDDALTRDDDRRLFDLPARPV